MTKILEFESRRDKYVFASIVALLLIVAGIMAYPPVMSHIGNLATGKGTAEPHMEMKSPQEYYAMFQCQCCGEPIDTNCCGMAQQAKAYLDGLLSQGLADEDEIVYRMVKEFGFGILMDSSREQDVREYMMSKASGNPPEISIDNPRHDFGTVSQSQGIVTTTFAVKNTGGSDLIIDNMDTSCMCTSASLIYNGEESPRFGMSMHGDNPDDFELVLPPGDAAQLKVYYDPMAHGKQEEPEVRITREVTITSNDPADFQKKVRIELTQVP